MADALRVVSSRPMLGLSANTNLVVSTTPQNWTRGGDSGKEVGVKSAQVRLETLQMLVKTAAAPRDRHLRLKAVILHKRKSSVVDAIFLLICCVRHIGKMRAARHLKPLFFPIRYCEGIAKVEAVDGQVEGTAIGRLEHVGEVLHQPTGDADGDPQTGLHTVVFEQLVGLVAEADEREGAGSSHDQR